MTTGAWVLVAAVGLACALGGWRAVVDGRFRRRAGAEQQTAAPSVLAGTPYADSLGERATLVQFSSAFCAPCRTTRVVLADVAGLVPGVVHVEVDADEHLALTRQLGIERTPTTLVLDADAREATRRSGQPRKTDVLAVLTRALPS